MGRKINIANEKGRDAMISFSKNTAPKNIFFVDENGNEANSKKYIKSTSNENVGALLNKYGDTEKLADAIINEDPEVNLEMTGKFIGQTSRVFINANNQIVFRISKTEKIYNPEGELMDERTPKYLESNIISDNPIKWSGKKIPKEQAYKKFVFTNKYQLRHDSGLTFDFLYDMAKELHESKSLMLLGSGKGTGPVIFQDGGKPFRVFLEGRVQDDKYALIMHLSNLELKALPK